jgi:hypothetical protein
VLATNLVALLTCVLCGTGAYLLARRWQLSSAAGLLCGVIFAFAPPRFFRMGQLHMTAVQWIPFTLAFLHSYFERGRRRDLILALGFFTLQVLSSGHGAVFLVVAIALLLAWRSLFGAPVTPTKWFSDFGALGAFLIAPALWVLIPYQLAQSEAGLRREYPADAMPGLTEWFASPSRLHVALQQLALGHAINDHAIAFLFPGLIALLLTAIALLLWRPARRSLASDATGFFLVLALISTALFTTWPVDTWRLVYGLPGFNFIRVPSRFILLVLLSLGMLSAIAFDRLTLRLPARSRMIAAAALAFALLLEYNSYPFSGVPYRVDVTATHRWLSTQPKPFVVAEVPVPSIGDLGAYERHQTAAMLHTTAHWQRTIHGYSGIRRPLHEQLSETLTEFPNPRSLAWLREIGVTHIVVHRDRYPDDRWPEIKSRLDGITTLALAHSEGPTSVYTFVQR